MLINISFILKTSGVTVTGKLGGTPPPLGLSAI